MSEGVQLTVPERDEKGLSELIALSAPDVAKLANAIEVAPISIHLGNLSSDVADAVGWDKAKILRIVRLLASLQLVRTKVDVPLDEFVQSVAAAAKSTGKSELQPSERFTEHLGQLLNLRTLFVSAKALDVVREQPKSYCSSRVVTDVRPVFDQEEAPAAGVLVHFLRIAYHARPTGEIREFFVAMSADDIRGLQEVLARAIRKESTLNSLIAKTDLPILELDFHNHRQ